MEVERKESLSSCHFYFKKNSLEKVNNTSVSYMFCSNTFSTGLTFFAASAG
jgi:hypothetical protein